MPNDVELLGQAGFADEEVEHWAATRRAMLATAGFSEPEIDNHFGAVHVPAEIPKPFLERLAQGTAAGRILHKFGEQFGEAYGTDPLGLSAESDAWLRKVGIFRDDKAGWADPIRFMNEALIYPSAQVLDATSRLPAAALWGISGAAGQGLEEVGSSHTSAMRFTRDLNSFLTLSLLRFGAEAPMTRITVHPSGAVTDQPIGTLPQSRDFRIAAKDIAGDAADLSTQEKLLQAWTAKGIHPAEIAEDAGRDPTIAKAIVRKDVDFLTAYPRNEPVEPASTGSVGSTTYQPSLPTLDGTAQPARISSGEPANNGLPKAVEVSTNEPEVPSAPSNISSFDKIDNASHNSAPTAAIIDTNDTPPAPPTHQDPPLPEHEWDPAIPRFSQLLDDEAYYKEVFHSRRHRDNFFAAYPHLEGHVTVHHAKPRKTFIKYKGIIPIEEVHDLDNLRGIPNEKNPGLHLSTIHNSWNDFYDDHPDGAFEHEIRGHAAQIDHDRGSEFNPLVERPK